MSPSTPIRWLRAHSFMADVMLAGFIGVLALIGSIVAATVGHAGDQSHRQFGVLAFVLVVAQVLPLAWRRQAPVPVLVMVAAATLGYIAADYRNVTGNLPSFIAVYGVAAHEGRPRSVRMLPLVGVGLAITAALEGLNHRFVLGGLISSTVFVAIAWVLGDNLRTRRAYLASLRERAERLERERVHNARRAVTEERTRIARELHDVIAHGVSVMVVQAGAARRVLRRDPDRAADALQSIELTGRQALDELRHLVGVLRKEEDATAELSPQPRVEDLDSLVAQMEEAGLPVELIVRGPTRALPSGIDLSVFRIVQEALTNSLKHAGPAHARVELVYAADQLLVSVVDDGRGPATQARVDGPAATARRGAGHGLVGMRERVALYGGELRAGPRPGGGYQVQAWLPVAAAAV